MNSLKFFTKIWKFEGQNDTEVQGHQFLNSSETFSLPKNTAQFLSYHIHKETYKHLNLHEKFDLEGQGHQFPSAPKPLDEVQV